ncbi:MAG: hypothetical protein SCALA702_15570 [Melioribacteraceae bacterium]|nr:MAG: hypothetical protein SCALA702_15570 [Melioribacteraceae bacterium]
MVSNIRLFKQLYVAGYIFLVTIASFIIIQIQDAGELLILFTVPIIISVLYFRIRIYLLLSVYLAAAGFVNSWLLGTDLIDAFELIAVIAFSTILASETIYKLNIRRLEAERQLRRMSHNKDRFFSLIAHDIKSPFSAFLGYTKILVNEWESLEQDETVRIYRSLDRTAKKIYKLLESLLEWSKIQAGRIENKPDLLNLKAECSAAIDIFRASANQKEVKLTNRVDKEIEVYFDEKILNTSLRNLVSNALKFTGSHGSIILNAERKGNYIFLAVRDTGIGMNPEEVEKLFHPENLHSKQGTAGEKGSGMGLILTNELIKIGGGNLLVESSVGGGTTFKIRMSAKVSGQKELH